MAVDTIPSRERSHPPVMNLAPTKTRSFYLACLFARFAAFAALVLYALTASDRFLADLYDTPHVASPLTIVWLLLILSMVVRLIPSRYESLGCQKIYSHRHCSTGKKVTQEEVRQANRGALWVLLSWLALNGIFFLSYWKGWIGEQFMVCLAGFYGVCDIICILFFCPFQAWMMHNRCCITCRIFDWDYIMICTPLFVIRSPLALAACLLSVLIFLGWEIAYVKKKEQFFVSGNAALHCSKDCPEQLCAYKRALSHGKNTSR